MWKVTSMVSNGTMTRQKDLSVAYLSLRVTHLLGRNVNHQNKMGKEHNVQANVT